MSVNTEEADPAAVTEAQKKELIDQPTVAISDEVEKAVKADEAEATISTEFTTGTVALWKRTHGFLSYKEGEDVNRIFVHQSNVMSDDKMILLRRGIDVKFKIESGKNGKTNAVEVQGLNGESLNFHQKHGENDTYDREILFNNTSFQGEVNFFSRLRSYGRIQMNEESIEKLKTLDASEEDLAAVNDLYFKEVDLDVVDFPAKIDRTDKVSFQIFNSSRGYGAMHIRTESGEPIPIFTQEDREAKRAQRKEERDENRKSNQKPKKDNRKKKENDFKRKDRTNNRRRNDGRRGERKFEEKKRDVVKVKKEFKDIEEGARFEGKVISFSVHRFGFIKMESKEAFNKLSQYGILKNRKICFRVQDIETEQRPPMVDVDTNVKFSINRMENGVLYATSVRNENEESIVSEKEYTLPEPRKILKDDEWVEGTVRFYNWRRGHGRIVFDDKPDEEFYFHRNDIKSDDKVPGVEEEMKVMCQVVDDPKGSAVTHVCNLDKTNLKNQVAPYLKPKAEEN
jgi:cold shock CspA family protein